MVSVSEYLVHLTMNQLHQLGLVLGLHATPTLDGIPQSQTFCNTMLTYWLQGKDDVMKRGGHTWRTLVNALENSLINQNEIAGKIKREKCKL